jgi:hypothetical protein
MTRLAVILILLWCAVGCTAKEARHDGDMVLDGAAKTADFLMSPPQPQPW